MQFNSFLNLRHPRSSIRLLSMLMTWANSLVEIARVYWVCYERILSVSSIQQVYEVAISTKQNSQNASNHDDAYETLRVDNREDGKNCQDRFDRDSIKTLMFCKYCSSIRRGGRYCSRRKTSKSKHRNCKNQLFVLFSPMNGIGSEYDETFFKVWTNGSKSQRKKSNDKTTWSTL